MNLLFLVKSEVFKLFHPIAPSSLHNILATLKLIMTKKKKNYNVYILT